jgi:hypothetical protein
MKTSTIARAFFALSAIHCGSSPKEKAPPSVEAPDSGEDAMLAPPDAVPDAPGFAADRRSMGPRLWIEATLAGGKNAGVELWASELGPVFGYSAHVHFDASHLSLSPDNASPEAPTVLAPDGPAKAVELWTQSAGDVGIGAVRRSPNLGEVPIVEATMLGSFMLEARRAGRSAIGIERAVVRRADGSFVSVSVAGGTLVTVDGGGS